MKGNEQQIKMTNNFKKRKRKRKHWNIRLTWKKKKKLKHEGITWHYGHQSNQALKILQALNWRRETEYFKSFRFQIHRISKSVKLIFWFFNAFSFKKKINYCNINEICFIIEISTDIPSVKDLCLNPCKRRDFRMMT